MVVLPWLRHPLLIGAGALGTVALTVAVSDRAAAAAVANWKPALERSLSRVLGQPVQLGTFRQLHPWGLELGPSRIRARGESRSSISLAGLTVTVAPLASLRQGVLVLQLTPRQAQVVLRPNNRGQFWVLGPRSAGQRPPRLELQLRLPEPARVQLEPARSRWQVVGDLRLPLHQRRLNLNARLRPEDGRGTLQLQTSGSWVKRHWNLQLRAQQLQTTLLPGSFSGRVGLRWQAGVPDCRGEVLVRRLHWRSNDGIERARLRCQGTLLRLEPATVRLGPWQATASAQARWQGGRELEIQRFELRRGDSWVRGSGNLSRGLLLQSQWQWRLGDLPGSQRLPAWLQQTALQGRLNSSGSWRQPQLALPNLRGQDPILGRWQASLQWSRGTLTLQQLRSAHLTARGAMPLQLTSAQGLRQGPLKLDMVLQNFPLQRLQRLVGTQLSGVLQAQGTLVGPLNRLVPRLQLQIDNPSAGPLLLAERWQGDWQGMPQGGGLLEMWSVAPAPAGRLRARFDRRWRPGPIALERGGGQLNLEGQPRSYRWTSQQLLLDGLSLRLPRARGQTLRGLLSGDGNLSLQPLAFNGSAQLERPAVPGLQLQRASISGDYAQRRYSVRASLEPRGQGNIKAEARGRWRGPFDLRISATRLGGDTLRQLSELWPLWSGRNLGATGRARDLGTLMITTLGQSLQQQLDALAQAQAVLQASGRTPGSRQGSLADRLRQLQAQVDADLRLWGPDLKRAQLDLAGKGHLWRAEDDADVALGSQPFVVRLQGALQAGSGELSLRQLPLTLLALLTPVPEGLRGSLNIGGRYRLGRRDPELALQLDLEQAGLGATSLSLPRGSVVLAGNALKLDLALRAGGAQHSVDLNGILPLEADSRTLDLVVASRGDGLRFLTALAEPDVRWLKGSADLQLLLRGSLNDPIANGFVRIRDGEMQLVGQTVGALQATVIFDFSELAVQELSAQVGDQGKLSAKGNLGLTRPSSSATPLTIALAKVPFNLPRIKAVANGQLDVRGSLLAMQLGGEVAIDQGSINAQPGRLAPARPGQLPKAPRKSVTQLLQENWDFQSPLLLVGSEVETNSSQRVLDAVPRFAALGFDDLRLRLGPNLKIVIPNAASFKTAGLLRLSGRLDPSLRARGVVRLLQGRLNLFTTSFSLDPEAQNVAIFTPALGLIPYLDIAMRTRVADSLATTGLGTAGSPSLAEIEAQGGLSSLNQLNLVRITVSVSAPADRLAQNIRLRSSPPMPESRLIALIGGNSLAGLSGSGAGAAIATVVGQTLLSPVLGGLSDAFGQRLSFALYPTYVNPNVTSAEALQSRRLAPQLVLGSEIGLDVTERFNVSVLAAPNRSDVPPQINLNLRATDLLNVQGAVDTQGAWQTQLQLFFRF